MSLDSLDTSIVKLLKQDPRMPYTQIANTLGVSRITVKNRIEKMIEQEQLILTAKLNDRSALTAILGLEVKEQDQWDECIRKLESLPWVIAGFRSFGKSNLRVIIKGGNDEELERRIDEFRYFHCVNLIDVDILGKRITGNV
ncbi:hypothetical protein DRN98_09690 [Methanosarcinales archaeon]|nr:MAG: hypothetical protein DRN98_09690 [Methanosarcinales archaeon]